MQFHYLEPVIALTTLTLSIFCIITGVTLRLLYKRKVSVEPLGWGILIVSVWNILNSEFQNILYNDSEVLPYILFFVTLLLPLPFFIYMNQLQKKRYQKIYYVLGAVVLTELVLYSVLHLTGIRKLPQNTPLMLILFSLSVLVMISLTLRDLYHGYLKEYIPEAIGMAAIWTASFAKIFPYFISGRKMQGNSFLPFGLLFLMILAMLNTIRELISMEQGKQQALSASEAKGRFLANMSHEIRTPLNAVLGMDAMILRECSEPQIKEYALDIQNAGQSLLSLINDILDLSKIESGKLEILPEEYDFSSLIHDIMNMINMKATDKGLTVCLSIDRRLPSRLYGDDVRLRQVLVNLMNNAVKYTEKGSVTLSVSGTASENDAISLTFKVKDTGIGIRKEDISKLFAEFERIEEQRNRNIEGTGLGMSITTQLLELMDSHLEVDSIYGEGSTFYFTLQQKIISAEPIGDLEERIRNQAKNYSYQVLFTAPDAHILVVDDNAVNRKVFVSLLKNTKVQIDEAGGGYECIDMTKHTEYDMIFLDHMMPDLDGIETLHRLKGDKNSPNSNTPVIALTANAISGAREMYIGEGFSNFLSKPIKPEKLEKLLLDNLPEDKIRKDTIPADSSLSDAGQPILSEPVQAEEEFPEIDGIDWEYALMHTGNASILKTTVMDFYKLMPIDAAELAQLFETLQTSSESDRPEALRQYRVKVHAMKSSAAMTGAVPLSGVAKMLEYAARDGNTAFIEHVTRPFLEEWENMHGLLRSFAGEIPEDDKQEADFEKIKELLPALGSAMNSLDIDTADGIMEQLNKYRYPDSLKSVMEQLNLAVTNLDSAKAAEHIEKLENYISNSTH